MSSTKFRDLSAGSKALIILEQIIFSGTLYLAIFLNELYQFIDFQVISSRFLLLYAVIFALLNQLGALALGLYNSKLRERFRGVFRRIIMSVSVVFFAATIINPFYGPYLLPVELLAIASLLSVFLISLFRYTTFKINLFGFGKRNILVLGSGVRASIIEQRMRRDVDRQDFTIHGYVVMKGDSPDGIQQEIRIHLEESLIEYTLTHHIDEIVVANDERRNTLAVNELFTCKTRGIEIIDLLDFIEREIGQIPINILYPSWIIYSNGFASNNHLRNTLDWVFNAIMALCLFILIWPVMLVTVLLMKITEGLSAPIFYKQERVGLDGERFNIIKFRSMYIDAEKHGAQMASENDSRITTIGLFIRKYRIDELPQLWNILLGEMGFVGPRPERPQFVKPLIESLPYYNERHNCKPGLTGWAQLNYPYGATEKDSLEKLKYDLYYIKHRSFLLDLLILIRTVEIVLFGKGR
ncbi:MAG: TIGR03013 family XrtA/PEP-CTERM system glycosyltransferase [Colwellia sp.]